jgi:hypothetical protein
MQQDIERAHRWRITARLIASVVLTALIFLVLRR